MVKNIIKSAIKVGAITGGVIVISEFAGSFGKGLLLGQFMRMGDSYAIAFHQRLSNANVHNPREKFAKWLITEVATWNSKQEKG